MPRSFAREPIPQYPFEIKETQQASQSLNSG